MNQSHPKHHTYTTIKKVGSGNFGSAYLVKSTLNNQFYIMKKIKLQGRSKQSKELILKEVQVMQQMNHCYIVKYWQSFVEGKQVCIVMEYAQKGDLEHYIDEKAAHNVKLSEEEVISWFIQLLLALKYIHDKKVVHRDLKPANIFITNTNELKIGDFGISKIMSQTFDMAKTKIGSPLIMAPQIWEGMSYNQKSDIWALGCVLYKMMMLKYPFQAENEGALIVKVYGKVPEVYGYGKEISELAKEMLDRDAKNRPTVGRMLQRKFIKERLGGILTKTINLQDQNVLTHSTSSSNHLKSSGSYKLLPQKRSLTQLTSSLTKKPPLSPSAASQLQQISLSELKQNYPMLLQENRHLRAELDQIKKGKEQLEGKVQKMMQRWRQGQIQVSKEQMMQSFWAVMSEYLYP